MLLPIALLHNEAGKLTAIRYLKFDAPIPNYQALATKDYNEIIVYKPTQNIIANTSVVEIPAETLRSSGKTTLNNLGYITNLDATGAPTKSGEYIQLITPKEIHKEYLEALIDNKNWELDCLARRNSNSARKELEIEYELRQLMENPESCNCSRIYGDNGKSIFDAGSICTVHAVDYTGKVFSLPLAAVVNLVTKGTVKVGNMRLAIKDRERSRSVDWNYTTYMNTYALQFIDSNCSVYKEELDAQSTLQGYHTSLSTEFSDNAIVEGTPFVIIPQGVSQCCLRRSHPSLFSITCPKAMYRFEYSEPNTRLKNLICPEEVERSFILKMHSVQNLVLPKRLISSKTEMSSYYQDKFILELQEFLDTKIAFEESQLMLYSIILGKASALGSIVLPIKQCDNSGTSGMSLISIGSAPMLSTIMLHRAKGSNPTKAVAQVCIRVNNPNYIIDCRMPLKRLHISFPEGATNYKVTIKHCGISKLTFWTDQAGNTVEIIPQVTEARINSSGYANLMTSPYSGPRLTDDKSGTMPKINIIRRRMTT